MSWEKDIEELRRRQALTQQMGGEERVAKHKSLGKLTDSEIWQLVAYIRTFAR